MTNKLMLLAVLVLALLPPVTAQTINTEVPPDVKVEFARLVTTDGELRLSFDMTNLGREAVTAWHFELKATLSNGERIHIGWAADRLIQYSYYEEHQMSHELGPLLPGIAQTQNVFVAPSLAADAGVVDVQLSIDGLILRSGTPIGKRSAIGEILASRNERLQQVEFSLETLERRRRESSSSGEAISAVESDMRSVYPTNSNKARVDLNRDAFLTTLREIQERVRDEPVFQRDGLATAEILRFVRTLEKQKADLLRSTLHKGVRTSSAAVEPPYPNTTTTRESSMFGRELLLKNRRN